VAGLLNGARRLSLPARIRGQRAAFTHAPQTRASRPVSASFTRVRKRKKKPPSVIRREGGQGKAGQGRAGQGRAGQGQGRAGQGRAEAEEGKIRLLFLACLPLLLSRSFPCPPVSVPFDFSLSLFLVL